jgi:hypothetical protein
VHTRRVHPDHPDRLEAKVHAVIAGLEVHKGVQVTEARRAAEEKRVNQAIKDHRDHRVPQDPRAGTDLRAIEAPTEIPENQAATANQVRTADKASEAISACLEEEARAARPENRDRRDQPADLVRRVGLVAADLRGPEALPAMRDATDAQGVRDHRARRVRRARLECAAKAAARAAPDTRAQSDRPVLPASPDATESSESKESAGLAVCPERTVVRVGRVDAAVADVRAAPVFRARRANLANPVDADATVAAVRRGVEDRRDRQESASIRSRAALQLTRLQDRLEVTSSTFPTRNRAILLKNLLTTETMTSMEEQRTFGETSKRCPLITATT